MDLDDNKNYMNKVIESVRSISNSLVKLIPALTVVYFAFLRYFGNFLPLPSFMGAKRIYVIILAISFLLLLPALSISSYSKVLRIFISIPAILFCCLFSYLATDIPEEILDSAVLDNHTYYVTVQGNIEPSTTYIVYRCNANSLKCQKIYTQLSGAEFFNASLIVDERMKEVHVLYRGYMIYTDGENPRRVLASEEYKGFIYNIGILPVDVYPIYGSSSEKYTYSLYRCNTSYKECQKLPFSYSDTGGSIWLIINEDTDELEVYNWQSNTNDVLIFTYGVKPKCHVEQCSYQDK